mmetsp:Transcript_18018/g.53937  ORF Transcript_18018/g.53937 Transcript_18018/m.53937 type:complete len:415 (-) Transcript_18018:810-2054(-)
MAAMMTAPHGSPRGVGMLMLVLAVAAAVLGSHGAHGQTYPPTYPPFEPTYPCNCLPLWEHERMMYSGCARIEGTNHGRPWCRINATLCDRLFPRSWKHCDIRNNPDPEEPYPAPRYLDFYGQGGDMPPPPPMPPTPPPMPSPPPSVDDLCPADISGPGVTVVAPAAARGTALVSAPPPGETTVVFCGVAGGAHCRQGMVFEVTRDPFGGGDDAPPRNLTVFWRLPGPTRYPPVMLRAADTLVLQWVTSGEHDVRTYERSDSGGGETGDGEDDGGEDDGGDDGDLSGDDGAGTPSLPPLPPAVGKCPGTAAAAATTELAPIGVRGAALINVTSDAVPLGATLYVFCSVGNHCPRGMIFAVRSLGAPPRGHDAKVVDVPWTVPAADSPYANLQLYDGDKVNVFWQSGAHDIRVFLV